MTPCAASARTSVMTCSSGRLTSSPRVYGTTQNVQYLLQPSMIETNAVAPVGPRLRQPIELLDLRES